MKYLNKQKLLITNILAVTLIVLLGLFISTANAAQVTQRSLTLSSPLASATGVTYRFGFTISSSYSLGSIVFEICTEDPLPNEPCTSPTGFDTSTTTLVSQSGQTGFSIHPNTTNNRLVLSRTASMSAPGALTYNFNNITNPNTDGTYYGRIYTYNSIDGTGTQVDDGGLAFAITKPVTISAEVPPYLIFCVGVSISGLTCSGTAGSFLDFGEFSSSYTSYAQSQMLVATNAPYGLSISSIGNTFTSGNNIIPALPSPTSPSIGNSQFGINLRDNSNPDVGEEPVGLGAASVNAQYNTPNAYKFVSGDAVASSSGTSEFKKFTVSYMVNVSGNQQPGIYTTTMLYNCLANF